MPNKIRDGPYKAIVTGIVMQGKHGSYAVTRLEESSTGIEGTITVSLTAKVWKDDELPEKGSVVVLEDLTRKVSGWRAGTARFLRPADKM